MNQGRPRILKLNFSKISNWLIILAVIWLLTSIGLGWSILILVGIVILIPVLLFVGVQWWLSRNLIQDECPICAYEFTALNQTQCQCPNCGEPLQVEQGHFNRLTPPGTIDVQAVDVSAQILDD
ncbi:hypothetical protein [Limnoraphis robusta]|uniref:Uncharacterized protein n=1 Tax=Limnoraphis robusta CCNP1315 TaxID=3110306 RepID=A0ABU5TXV3_9CYAN|nr:hypothetical protein [Limnoraphis robusta]MEA5501500.1 hypothetical protein [Limnoraphis robusta BA-68 BA1]MEA5519471.1 hypothetical protein [Limnoraphis robusta CCNP1315]MEA5548061.1 hypothetical protein [Limnoraphis robusta CCNP1324]